MPGPIEEAPLGEALASELTWLAMCWRVVRLDGVALGFTTHDEALTIAGMRYENAPGMTPSAIVRSDGLDVDTMDVGGALRSDAISGEDLALGRYDGAEVRLSMVDWRTPDAGSMVLAHGTLGTVESGTGPDAGFTAALRGPTSSLAVTRIETYSPECRAELGDWRCRVAMRGRTARTVIATSDGEQLVLESGTPEGASSLLEGRLRILSGTNAGIERRIIAVGGVSLVIDEPLAVPPGTLVEVREGCDKRFATCAGRFRNAANFRGEPHVPGGDVLTRFPGL